MQKKKKKQTLPIKLFNDVEWLGRKRQFENVWQSVGSWSGISSTRTYKVIKFISFSYCWPQTCNLVCVCVNACMWHFPLRAPPFVLRNKKNYFFQLFNDKLTSIACLLSNKTAEKITTTIATTRKKIFKFQLFYQVKWEELKI